MSEGMTPERRAEIERVGTAPALRDYFTPGAEAYHRGVMIGELLAEIDRLNKVVDQALRWIPQIVKDEIQYTEYDGKCNPDLAAELQRRGK